jgi:Uma2 family endonuclease
MTLTAEMPKQVITPRNGSKPTKPITWEAFKSRYLSREDGYTYELVNGQVEKTKWGLNYKQLYIFNNLFKAFEQLKTENKISGLLANGLNTFLSNNYRELNICYLTNEQIQSAKNGLPPMPNFVIEVISNNDKMKRVQEKMLDYWRAEVPIIWHIFPDLKIVHVYHGKQMTVYMGDEICSAMPILPDFNISVNDIFK